jgi:peroxiredoxin
MFKTGEKAPDFTLTADDGSEVSLSDFRGKKVVLYFYPKADTSGCTRQACAIRDVYPDIERASSAATLRLTRKADWPSSNSRSSRKRRRIWRCG